MITWKGPKDRSGGPSGDGLSGDDPPAAEEHPDLDPATGNWKRPRVTPAGYNAYAEKSGWSARVQPDLVFRQPELMKLCELWLEVANRKGSLPARTDFDAAALQPFVTHIAFVECIPQKAGRSRYRIRQIGSELVRLFGDRTGQYIDEYFPANSLPAWLMGYDVVVDAGAPMRITQKFILPLMSHLEGEAFSAPLAAEGKSARGLFTALYVRPKEGVVG